ncbi:SERUM RESPONSE FACTOR-like protein [Salix viminalis]|uniref:SERUM RESPONSE FACTOR-like protein n=1 Tax=Salix viminalis TaxID=40686 RepID=A0A9Q0T7B9_SALVM|nr:SERUM RESPONSE FACTOR-like protein [Salix viminalis]
MENKNLAKRSKMAFVDYIYVQEASNLRNYINLEHDMDNILNNINCMLIYIMETASSRSTDSPVQLHYHELSTQQEYLKLKGRYESLQRTQRNLLGEDLGPLSSKDLESLERQLDMSLKQIRSTRTQYMLDQLNDLQHKEHMLTAANKSLKERVRNISELGGS